ncbi:MAG: glycoside hydrolase family 2 protein [Oscillospiraceae bacterium]|nr:glycoside hydrolase family 2 protein [Oscillospiraceae bacterium]
MRRIVNINRKWAFTKFATEAPMAIDSRWDFVNLPHTWNALDGQDGDNDYFRGTGWYAKEIDRDELPEADKYFIEFQGANSVAELYVNGVKKMRHEGGYSTWRCDITSAIKSNQRTFLAVSVDNSPNENVYPQMADFTFYGGLYRDVNIICVKQSHFDLHYHGSPAIRVTPIVTGRDALVKVRTFVTGRKEHHKYQYIIRNAKGEVLADVTGNASKAQITILNVHLWNGLYDPYLYSVQVNLLDGDEILDSVSTRFGCRSFYIDPDKGFILNGAEYPLRGVSRHQDRWDVGNALLPKHHEEDVDLICEMGANTVRLAHYQQDQYFYDLCDERGLIVWAEIPYISRHMPGGRENSVSQMKELIHQNYNHPSIVVWGLSNDITMQVSEEPDMLENHRVLNDLAHTLDKTRLTAMAAFPLCPTDGEIIQIPEVVSYNQFFGWYGGETAMTGPWFDKFHAKYPNIPVGCSGYGAEALNWHSSDPVQGDYTEEYQARYHEEMIKTFFSRKYIWAAHCWNMFDFGADARCEGGGKGQNYKGLVTIDRKYKKDAFYAYKAWLSEEPFVHICGKRYVDRVEDVARITVYSNRKNVELFANGVSLGVKEADDHFFRFDVPNVGQTKLVAVAGRCRDESLIRKVEEFNEDYCLREKNPILTWYDVTKPEGYFSLQDKVGDIIATLRGKVLLMKLAADVMPHLQKDEAGKTTFLGYEVNNGLLEILGSFTVLRLAGMLGRAGIAITREQLLELNAQLNKIKKK